MYTCIGSRLIKTAISIRTEVDALSSQVERLNERLDRLEP